MATLTAGVVLRHPGTGEPVFLPAGSSSPDWAAGLLGEHVLDGPANTVEDSGDLPDLDELDPDDPARTPDAAPPVPAAPPKFGQGSSRARWIEYAAAVGVHVAPDDSRDDIVAACAAADVPTS